MYTTSVERTISAAHHNGPPNQKCYRNHGHEWEVYVEFSFLDERLDKHGWGPNFITIKEVIDKYDHNDLNELMDVPPSAENLAARLFGDLTAAMGLAPDFVRVGEGNGNYVTYSPDPEPDE